MGFIKLGFVGSYKVDLLHYLSRVLVALDKKVLVVDASTQQKMSVTLPNLENSNQITVLGIEFLTYMDNINEFNKINFNGYEIVLIDYGVNLKIKDDFKSCNLIFVVTDFQKHNVMEIKELIHKGYLKGINVVEIFRDVIKSKISITYIDHLLDIDKYCNVLTQYVFEFLESDYKCRLLTQYDDVFKFSKLSKAYKSLLADILIEMFSLKKTEVSKAIKRAEGAKFICK